MMLASAFSLPFQISFLDRVTSVKRKRLSNGIYSRAVPDVELGG
jgi:hypothetical protein